MIRIHTGDKHICCINLINVIYVIKDLVRMVAYRNTLEYILVINLINVAKCLVRMVTYRNTLEYILVINLNNMLYIIMVKDFR
jgi:hypothetical protein